MPRGDKSGPTGQGAMTGRGLGDCGSGNRRFVGYGQGRGRGFNRGVDRNFRYNTVSNTAPSLEDEKRALEDRLNEINKHLDK